MLNLTVILNLIILIFVFLAIYVVFGVIWRTKNGLDTCHKYLLVAIILLGIGSVLRILDNFYLVSAGIVPKILDFLFIAFFILGLEKMRYILRRINEEIK